MADRVLVAYASKYGATAEIAKKIGDLLLQEGLQADVSPADKTGNLVQYDAYIIGSAVYIGQWRKEASKFLKDNELVITGQPVWLFSSGPTGEGDPVELVEGWNLPKSLQPIIDRMRPVDIAVFHGVTNMEKLNFFERFILRMVKSPTGDYRDWDAIAAWTKTIAEHLKSLDKKEPRVKYS